MYHVAWTRPSTTSCLRQHEVHTHYSANHRSFFQHLELLFRAFLTSPSLYKLLSIRRLLFLFVCRNTLMGHLSYLLWMETRSFLVKYHYGTNIFFVFYKCNFSLPFSHTPATFRRAPCQNKNFFPLGLLFFQFYIDINTKTRPWPRPKCNQTRLRCL